MSRNRYESKRTTTRFKQIGQGLRAGEDRIREQRKTEIDALKLARAQEKERNQAFISGLGDKFKFEEGVLGEKQRLEGKIRQHKYEALKKKAETDVARIEGQAKELGKKVAFWKDFTPKFAKSLQQGATAIGKFQDIYRGEKQFQAIKESGILTELIDQQDTAVFGLDKTVTKEQISLNDPNETFTLWGKTTKINTNYAARRLAVWFKENKDLIKSDAIDSWNSLGGERYNKDNAVAVHKFNAQMLLRRVGLPETTRGGQQIMAMAEKIGWEENKLFTDKENVELTSSSLKTQSDTLKTFLQPENSTEFINNFNKGVDLARKGSFETKKGIITPSTGARSLADGYELYVRYLIENNNTLFKFKDEKEFEEFLGKTLTPQLKDGEKQLPWSARHPDRTERLIEVFVEKKKEELQLAKDKQLVDDSTYVTTLDNSVTNEAWLYEVDENGAVKTDDSGAKIKLAEPKTQKQWWLEEINKAADNPNLSADSKKIVYRLAGMDPAYDSVPGQYTTLQGLINDGDLQGASVYFSRLSTENRNKLRPIFTIGQELKDFTRTRGNTVLTGIPAITYEIDSRFKDAEGKNFSSTSRLHGSASGAKTVYLDYVLKKYAEFRGSEDYKDKPMKALEAAFLFVKDEYDKGAPKDKDTPGIGVFARTTSPTGVTGQTQLIYTNWNTDRHEVDGVSLDLINERLGASKDGTLAAAQAELKNIKIQPMSAKSVELLTRLGYGPTMLKNADFISPDTVTDLREQALIRSNIVERSKIAGIEVDVSKVPLTENMRLYARANDKTDTEAVNDLLKHWGYKERWPTNSGDLTKINNGNKAVKSWNELGFNIYNAFKNQQYLPKSQFNHLIIDKKQPFASAFKKVNGIDWKRRDGGGIQFTDLKKFVESGGINILIREGLQPALLQELGFIDEDVDLGDLPAKRDIKSMVTSYRRSLDRERTLAENETVTTM